MVRINEADQSLAFFQTAAFVAVRRVQLVNQRAFPHFGGCGNRCPRFFIGCIVKTRAQARAMFHHHVEAQLLQLGNGGGGAGHTGFTGKGLFWDTDFHVLFPFKYSGYGKR